MALTQFSGPVFSQAGFIGATGLVPSNVGKVFFVDYARGSDVNDGSYTFPFKTLSYAHTKMTADQNDIVYVVGGNSATTYAVRESTTLSWTKNLCHIIGLDAHNKVAHRVSIRATSGATAFTPLVSVTASGCIFANFHVFDGNAVAAAIAWKDAGQRNSYYNVHIGGIGDLTGVATADTGSRSLVLSGAAECYFKDCTIGLDTASRTVATAEIELKSSATRNIFEDCLILTFAGAATPVFIKADASSSAIDRFAIFKNCIFSNPINSTATTMTVAIVVDAALSGTILLKDCTSTGATKYAASAKVKVDGAVPTGATTGLSVTSA